MCIGTSYCATSVSRDEINKTNREKVKMTVGSIRMRYKKTGQSGEKKYKTIY